MGAAEASFENSLALIRLPGGLFAAIGFGCGRAAPGCVAGFQTGFPNLRGVRPSRIGGVASPTLLPVGLTNSLP